MNIIVQRQKVGSIGAAWPPTYERRNARVKGFCPFKVDDNRLLERLRSDLREAREQNPEATRSTARAFIRRELRDMAPDVEARVPANRVFPGYDLVYIGSNSESRQSQEGILQEELEGVTMIMEKMRRQDPGAVFGRVSNAGYSVGRLRDVNTAAVAQLLELYDEAYQEYTFDINSSTIMDMLNNGNIVLVGRSPEGTIVSCLIAEHASVEVDGQEVHLYELSDYATLRAHRRNGLITAMQIMAVETIRELEHGQESIIYAEDRAAWMAVNISSRRAGLVYCGTLEKHCRLVSDRTFAEEGNLENLNVWVSE